MFERPRGGERAILVQLALPIHIDPDDALAEFKQLALSAQAEIVDCVVGARTIPEPKYFIGLGKAEEVRELVIATQTELILVNHELSPSQERNLERLLQCRVVDRSGLILDIFAQRARTFEGKLQVELAQLEHLSTRLVRGWTHLERQKGGIGLRGPGETQLETDRRLLRDRIKTIHKRLENVRRSREQNRRARQKASIVTVSLVGYTNAGKSTLFNTLTGAHIFAADQLFATLDPTMRKLPLPGAPSIMLADTVGFIRDLPHSLINAFHATLEEVKEADLILHVIDISDPNWHEHVKAVEQVLTEIDAEKVKFIQVFNKIDAVTNLEAKSDWMGNRVWLSAAHNIGIDFLQEAIIKQLWGAVVEENVVLQPSEAKLRAELYRRQAVVKEQELEGGGWQLTIRLSKEERLRLFPK